MKEPTLSGGLLTKLLMLALGVMFMSDSFVRGLTVRPALTRQPGVPATRTHRILFFAIGAATTYEAIKFLSLCP